MRVQISETPVDGTVDGTVGVYVYGPTSYDNGEVEMQIHEAILQTNMSLSNMLTLGIQEKDIVVGACFEI